MVLVIDNYDSFTYNLVQYLGELGGEPAVKRNDAISVADVDRLPVTRIVISPGPGGPEEAGVSVEIVRAYAPRVPILGVCLGHQAIGVAFGGRIVPAPTPVHGKRSMIEHDGGGVFAGLAAPFPAGRYHSLAIERATLPRDLVVGATAREDGVIMGVRHRRWPVHGVQFHPESVLTAGGRRIVRNFLEGRGGGGDDA